MFNFTNRNDVIIDELKEQRSRALAQFDRVALSKNEEIAKFFYTKFQVGEDVPFSILEDMPIGEALLLPVVYGGAIITTKLSDRSEKKAKYETKWTPGSTLTWHFHSDCIEEITVNKGRVKVFVQGSVHVLHENQRLTVASGVGHQITALKESTLDIEFTKIETND